MSCSFLFKNIIILPGGKYMNQKKIGQFLKELRKEKGITQEQLSEILGISSRSISRWENGINMPDFDLVIEITKYFEISVDEFLDGRRKNKMIDKKQEQTLLKVVDYSNTDKIIFSKRLHYLFIVSIVAFMIYMILDINDLTTQFVYEDIASFSLGIVLGALIIGAIYTSRYIHRITAFKMRLLNKGQNKA